MRRLLCEAILATAFALSAWNFPLTSVAIVLWPCAKRLRSAYRDRLEAKAKAEEFRKMIES